MSTNRTNDEWLQVLRGADSAGALAELRAILVRGLGAALSRYERVTAADLEDFTQEALLKILANLDSFEGRSRFTTWAHKIAVRVALSELRRRRWRDVSIDDLTSRYDDQDFTPGVLADPGAPPDRIVERRMLLNTVSRLMEEGLTERQRRAVLSTILEGMPVQEVAERMGTNRNALYKLVHDARRRLRRKLEEHGLTAEGVLAAFAD
jgi:RNA polymerase sigma-70 factor (ECF subfamily)